MSKTLRKGCVRTRRKCSVRNKVIRVVMKEKLYDAYCQYRLSKYEGNAVWRKEKKLIQGEIRRGYQAAWRTYVGQVGKKLKEGADKKVDWLVTKWRGKDIPDMYEGIQIKTDISTVIDNSPRLYGGVDVDDNEKAALLLPPKFALFEKINITQCRVQLEEALNKLRWNKLAGDRVDKEPRFFDRTDNTIDINNLKATALPFNPSVKIPGPVEQKEEVKIAKFRDEVMEAVEEVGRGTRKCGHLTDAE